MFLVRVDTKRLYESRLKFAGSGNSENTGSTSDPPKNTGSLSKQKPGPVLTL